MYVTMSTSTGLYPKLDLWKVNKLQYKCDHKVHIIGDSHPKGSATKINHYLNTNFVVSSFIKPGAKIKQTAYSQETEFKCLREGHNCG